MSKENTKGKKKSTTTTVKKDSLKQSKDDFKDVGGGIFVKQN